ncbi:MAG: hypothetical protein ACXABY_35295 [Candidatus Thorarchaeota archaeon]|jgi:hypothetical protein
MACENQWAAVDAAAADVDQSRAVLDAADADLAEAQAALIEAQDARAQAFEDYQGAVAAVDAAYASYRECITGGSSAQPVAATRTTRTRTRVRKK